MLDNLTTKQKKIFIIIIVIIAIGIIYFIYKKTYKSTEIEVNEDMLIQSSNENNNIKSDELNEFIIIHIAGAVKNPGVVKLVEGSRIEDAVEVAGGLTEDADITNVNLAYVLEDGTKIKIPSITDIEDEEDIIQDESGENIVDEATNLSSTTRYN